MVETVKDMYMPSVDITVQVTTARAHLIQFAGKQKLQLVPLSPSGRLAGLVPALSDWHTKVILL